jgi:transmembrane sensor
MMVRKETDQMIESQARDWLVRFVEDDPSRAERQALAAWRKADRRHENAYLRAEGLWRDLAGWGELAELEPLDDMILRERVVAFAQAAGARLRQLVPVPAGLRVGAVVAVLVMIVGIGFLFEGQAIWPSDQMTTQVAEISDIDLPDGSLVTLGARSKIEVDFTDTERRVVLVAGEAFFSVTKDPARPFYVSAGETLVRVVGTKFEVRRGAGRVRIAVAEGIVEVSGRDETALVEPSGRPITKTTLTAGQQIVAMRGFQLQPVREISESAPGAWREGRLVYVDATLAEVIADANRYFDSRIEFAAPELADLRLTASFRTDQIEEMIDTVATALPLSVDRSRPGIILLEKALTQ